MCPMSPYLLVQNVTTEVQPPATGMLTHTLLNDASMKIIVFGFAAGHEMAAHKAPMPTMLHFLQGEATLTVGTDSHQVEAGALIHMQPELMHGIIAKTLSSCWFI